MQFIKNKELYPRSCSIDKCMLFRTDEHQFQHHIVGEKYMGLILLDLFSLFILLLSGVFTEIDGAGFPGFLLIAFSISLKSSYWELTRAFIG